MNLKNRVSGYRTCSKCHISKELNCDNFHKSKSRLLGFEYKCKNCEKERSKSKVRKIPIITIESKSKQRVRSYKYTDNKKGFDNNISEDYIQEVLDKPCHYCGFPSTGLDRIDNSIGHTITNCVPSCKECNVARMNNFSYKEMIIIGKTIRVIKKQRNENKILLQSK